MDSILYHDNFKGAVPIPSVKMVCVFLQVTDHS